MSIIKATIKDAGSNKYSRLGISRKDLKLFNGVKDLEINYRKEKIKVNLNNRTFKTYGEINHSKIKEWSGNKLSNIEIDIAPINNGKIKIIKIITTKEDDKTIAITIRFWTNDLPDKVGGKKDQTPFWTGGNVHLHANRTKKIRGQDELFHYLDDIPRAIKEVMKKSKLVSVTDIAYTLRAGKRKLKEL